MTETNTDPKPCPAFSPGGEYCPWCGKHVGEYGWMRDHTPKPKPTPAAPPTAREAFEALAHEIGAGFHPDTAGDDYEPALSDPHGYDRIVAAAFADGTFDPYDVALDVILAELKA